MRYQTAPRPGDGSILDPSGRPDSNRLRELGRLQCNQLHLARARLIIGSHSRLSARADAAWFAKLSGRGTVLSAGSPAAHLRRMPLPRSRPTLTRAWATLAAAVALLAIVGATLAAREAQGASSQKNVVFILTDDMTASELSAMPNVESPMAGPGTGLHQASCPPPPRYPPRPTYRRPAHTPT